jgi:subtilisin family serine protease
MKRMLFASVATLVLLSGTGAVSLAASPPAAATLPMAEVQSGSVTLITGDRVELASDGTPQIARAEGRAAMPFRVSRTKDGLQVVPGDAAALIAAGRLDPRLFDVTGLLAQGYDDTRRADLPLIVQFRAGAARSAIASATTVRQLSSVDGAAVSVAKKNAPDWWKTVARSTDPGRALGAGLAKVWLNGHRRLTLDRSAEQIGAPAAWRAGLTGRQVRVAVIDSGIDASHPDLNGKVDAVANFTADPAGDQIGHGTHVASITAGSGAASGGKYRGIAPDARLLDAKVCGQDGQCAEDAILAGLEWAAATQHAQVANVSLGSSDTTGVDPVEQAVDTLSARYGTLFVVAAGNSGPFEATVESPGSAEAALTVGAVDRDDAVAEFSSRGPRTGDAGLKPDVTAPGVGIVAARAEGTELGEVVDDRYVAVSGTSMATPHVAGAAALLVQQHPEWTGEQVKATLMASAQTTGGSGVLDQGAGRIDIATAITQSVGAAPASVGFGVARWPHKPGTVLSKTVAYRNTGSADVTLDLTLTVSEPAPSQLFAVQPSRVVVPAGGTAAVTVTADTGSPEVPAGRYVGRLVASGTGVMVTTPVGVEKESEHYDVELTHIGRDGGTPDSYVTFLDRLGDCGDDPACGGVAFGAEPKSTLRLPPGRYTMAEFSSTAGTTDISLLMQFVLDVSGDSAVTLDARRAKPVELTVPRASARLMALDLGVSRDMGRPDAVLFYTVSGDHTTPVFTADLGGSRPAEEDVVSFVQGRFAEPGPAGDFFASPYEYQVAEAAYGRLFTGLRLRPHQQDFATVESQYLTYGSDREFSTGHGAQPTTGRPELLAFPGGFDRIYGPLPFHRTEYFLARNLLWRTSLTTGDRETGIADFILVSDSRNVAYQPGRSYQRVWNRGVFGPQLGERQPRGALAGTGAVRAGDAFTAAIDQFVDAVPGHVGMGSKALPGSVRLYQDGRLVTELPYAGPLRAELPPQPATYRLEMSTAIPAAQVSTEVDTAWTFQSGHVDGVEEEALPLLGVRYTPMLDDHNHAQPGSGFRIPMQVYRQPGASGSAVIANLGVEVSYDDGDSWHSAPVTPDGTRWLAIVDNPAAGAVSLRAKVTDTDGNKLEQSVIRAYLVNE